eukprot:15149471-Heterocapsa_arctica.AAC.1
MTAESSKLTAFQTEMDKLCVDKNAEYKQNKVMTTKGLPMFAQCAAMLLFLQLLLRGGSMDDIKHKKFEKKFVKNACVQDLIRVMSPEFKRIMQPLMGFILLSATNYQCMDKVDEKNVHEEVCMEGFTRTLKVQAKITEFSHGLELMHNSTTSDYHVEDLTIMAMNIGKRVLVLFPTKQGMMTSNLNIQ